MTLFSHYLETVWSENRFKRGKHNARKNETYSNMNVDLSQTPNNVYYKQCDITLNEKVKELEQQIVSIIEG